MSVIYEPEINHGDPVEPLTTLYESGRLYKKDSNGNIRVWSGRAFHSEDNFSYYETISGVLTGKQKKHVTEAKPSAKLTEDQVAVSKIKSAESSKLKKGYFRTQEEAENYKPNRLMLVHKWPDYQDRISFPCIVQPKLDGICAGYMDTDDPHFKSRENNRFEKLDPLAQRISKHLDMVHGIDRDRCDAHGELYVHGKTVSELVEGLKGSDADMLKAIEFFIFDFMPSDAPDLWYANRLTYGLQIYGTENIEKPYRFIKTGVARDTEDIESFYTSYVRRGYEGVIIANRTGKYEYDRRTYDKLKYKQLFSEEFEIVAYDVERNGEEELIMFTCKTSEGATFKVRPKWSHEVRAAAYRQQANGSIDYIGEMATVEYRSLTAYKTPFHGVLIHTRNYE